MKLDKTRLFSLSISKISLIRVVNENMQLSVNTATNLLFRSETVITYYETATYLTNKFIMRYESSTLFSETIKHL